MNGNPWGAIGDNTGLCQSLNSRLFPKQIRNKCKWWWFSSKSQSLDITTDKISSTRQGILELRLGFQGRNLLIFTTGPGHITKQSSFASWIFSVFIFLCFNMKGLVYMHVEAWGWYCVSWLTSIPRSPWGKTTQSSPEVIKMASLSR